MKKDTELYKFKTGDKRNLNYLLNDELWVSNLLNMNDPTDLKIYVNKKTIKYRDEDMIKFYNFLASGIYCISFTTNFDNERMWDYYSDGFRGFVLCYSYLDIKSTLDKYGLKGNDNKVKYDDKSFDFTKVYKKFINGKIDEVVEWEAFFTKNQSWKDEKEYRFSINTPVNLGSNEKGFPLKDIKPIRIIVGFKINQTSLNLIKNYCKKNKIKLQMYMPRFDKIEKDYKLIDLR